MQPSRRRRRVAPVAGTSPARRMVEMLTRRPLALLQRQKLQLAGRSRPRLESIRFAEPPCRAGDPAGVPWSSGPACKPSSGAPFGSEAHVARPSGRLPNVRRRNWNFQASRSSEDHGPTSPAFSPTERVG
jgi:hypothetical protein